jgi:hypothetical protein
MVQERAVSDLKVWFERDIRYAQWDRDVEIVYDQQADVLRIRLYTETNSYMITASTEYGRDYLGCIAWSRKARAGEQSARGNDLPDGPLVEDTWHSILAAIVGYELVKIHRDQCQQPAAASSAISGVPALPLAGSTL